MSTLYASRPCVDPTTLHRECEERTPPIPTERWIGKANLFRNWLGSGPGRGHILLRKADLDAIDLTTDHPLTFADGVGNVVTLKRVTLLRSDCITPGYRDDPQAVHLCEVVDRRFFLAQIPVDRSYNVRSGDGTDYLSGSLDEVGGTWAWSEIVRDLWLTCGLGEPPALPFEPDGVPENLLYFGGWAWAALNDVLTRLACAVQYDPQNDTFSLVRLGDLGSAATVAATRTMAARDAFRTWESYSYEPDRGRLPANARVLFPRRPQPTDGNSVYYAVDVPLPTASGVVPGTFVILHDDLTAQAEDGQPWNVDKLNVRAAERAADWWRKRIGYERRTCVVYRDFDPRLVALPGEMIAATAIDDRGGAMQVEVYGGPDGGLEAWRPWEQPLVLPRDEEPGSESSSGSANGQGAELVSYVSCEEGSGSGEGSLYVEYETLTGYAVDAARGRRYPVVFQFGDSGSGSTSGGSTYTGTLGG